MLDPSLFIQFFFYGKGFVVESVFVSFVVLNFLLINGVVKELQEKIAAS